MLSAAQNVTVKNKNAHKLIKHLCAVTKTVMPSNLAATILHMLFRIIQVHIAKEDKNVWQIQK